MKKEKYERTELDIIAFQTDDILNVSQYEEDELEFIPNR